MSQQTCFVCKRIGIVATSRIHVTPEEKDNPGMRLIGQCPDCGRYICIEHSELLPVQEQKGWWQRPSGYVACCPFDPGVPLSGPE